jgi:hypothetical protein
VGDFNSAEGELIEEEGQGGAGALILDDLDREFF